MRRFYSGKEITLLPLTLSMISMLLNGSPLLYCWTRMLLSIMFFQVDDEDMDLNKKVMCILLDFDAVYTNHSWFTIFSVSSVLRKVNELIVAQQYNLWPSSELSMFSFSFNFLIVMTYKLMIRTKNQTRTIF